MKVRYASGDVGGGETIAMEVHLLRQAGKGSGPTVCAKFYESLGVICE
jgi:hypothetical protein